ncbi:MAG: alpha/beta hydrolase [Candidatus Baltobacteraceae bacterium]
MKHLCALAFCAIFAIGFATPAGAATPTASYDVGTIHVDQFGSGKPALVLIPGLSSGAWVWDGVIAKFSSTHTIYAITLAGFDGRPTASAPLMPKAADDIVRLIADKHVDKPVIIGHSLGGTLAIEIAERHSDLLCGVIAVEGLPVFPGFETMTPAQRSAAAAQMAGQISNATHDQFLSAMKAYVMPGMVTDKATADWVAVLSAKSDPSAAAQYLLEDASSDTRPELSKISAPVLEIAPFDATVDGRPPISLANAAAKQTYYAALLKNDPTAKVEMIGGYRHFVMYDQPEKLDAAISAFLQTHP